MTGTGQPPRRRLVVLWDTLVVLVSRDIRLRYKRSVMGLAWTLLNPLAELLVLWFIFGVVLPLNIPDYPAFLFTGILVFGWFQGSLVHSANAIVNSRELIRQPGFPPAVLPVVTVSSSLIHFLLALPILLVVLVAGDARLGAALLGVPVLVAVQFALTLAIGYVVAATQVRFRDTQYLLKVFLQFLFYLSPVFYSPADVPERFRAVYHLNPMVFLIDAYRGCLMRGEWPRALPLAGVALLSVALLGLGLLVFRRAGDRFVEELG